MSDLDDEELEATRRLNGVDKKDSIEKDIKRCEELIKPEHANWIGISNQLAIAHVVDRVKELEEENKSKQKAYDDCYCEYKHYKQFDSIPKEKIKESYLKMEKEYARKVYDDNYNRNEVKKEEFYKRQVYEELLEKK